MARITNVTIINYLSFKMLSFIFFLLMQSYNVFTVCANNLIKITCYTRFLLTDVNKTYIL